MSYANSRAKRVLKKIRRHNNLASAIPEVPEQGSESWLKSKEYKRLKSMKTRMVSDIRRICKELYQ